MSGIGGEGDKRAALLLGAAAGDLLLYPGGRLLYTDKVARTAGFTFMCAATTVRGIITAGGVRPGKLDTKLSTKEKV